MGGAAKGGGRLQRRIPRCVVKVKQRGEKIKS